MSSSVEVTDSKEDINLSDLSIEDDDRKGNRSNFRTPENVVKGRPIGVLTQAGFIHSISKIYTVLMELNIVNKTNPLTVGGRGTTVGRGRFYKQESVVVYYRI
jgi:hypothetical protein